MISLPHWTRYRWLTAHRSQQDCIVDHKLEHKSELLAVTATLDCHWYSASDTQSQTESRGQDDEPTTNIKVELLAVLKKTDLCARLRKIDFREFLLS